MRRRWRLLWVGLGGYLLGDLAHRSCNLPIEVEVIPTSYEESDDASVAAPRVQLEPAFSGRPYR